jgi:predicted nucleic acid-binding Zn ribbon protein
MAERLPTADGDRDPRRVSESLDRLIRHLGAPASADVAAVFERWSELVGEQVAGHARPISLRGGVLTIAVDDPAWASQLGWLEGQLLDGVAAHLDAPVDRLDVRVEPRPSRS